MNKVIVVAVVIIVAFSMKIGMICKILKRTELWYYSCVCVVCLLWQLTKNNSLSRSRMTIIRISLQKLFFFYQSRPLPHFTVSVLFKSLIWTCVIVYTFNISLLLLLFFSHSDTIKMCPCQPSKYSEIFPLFKTLRCTAWFICRFCMAITHYIQWIFDCHIIRIQFFVLFSCVRSHWISVYRFVVKRKWNNKRCK